MSKYSSINMICVIMSLAVAIVFGVTQIAHFGDTSFTIQENADGIIPAPDPWELAHGAFPAPDPWELAHGAFPAPDPWELAHGAFPAPDPWELV